MTKSSSSHDTTQDSRNSLEGTNRSEGDKVQSPHDSLLFGDHTSDRAKGALNLKELFSICTNLSNRVLSLETIKDAQDANIIALKARLNKLEKMCKPSILHHRARLKSVQRLSMKKRFGKKESGRLSEETKELVRTARPGDSTVWPYVGTADPIVPPSTTKSKGVSEEPQPAKKMNTSDLDAAQIAKDAKVARLVYEEELAELEREKEKRKREEKASKAVIAEMYDEVQAVIEADALFAANLQ
uniref:Uncharacterized protein n=1 Tax=Tanacetum cinerariifolium TaxID=118510 RepID=A0A699JXM7_TANCI|nr:hypothetical protein [Tanacetum cinerariifolium]